METDQASAATSHTSLRHGKSAFPLTPCIWAGASVAVAVVSVFCLSESEWFPRAFSTAVLTFFTGGLIPLLLARAKSPRRTESIFQNICVVGYAACILTAQEDGFPQFVWLLVLCALFAVQMLRPPYLWGAYVVAGIIMGGILVFSGLNMRSSLSRGERVFQAYGCYLCHGSAQNAASSFRRIAPTSPLTRERLYLHFYAPELTPYAACPPTPSLFVRQTGQPGEFSPWALPVKISADEEFIPTASARALADFLLSHRPPNSAGENHDDMISRGESLFYAKCAACHGRNGLGDGINYPPLTDIAKYRDTPEELYCIILNGKSGVITVQDREWNSVMLPPGITGERDAKAVLLYLQRRFMP